MLILLAAVRLPTLRRLVEDNVLTAGTHLRRLMERWKAAAGGVDSPSVEQAFRMICEIDGFIQREYVGGGGLSGVGAPGGQGGGGLHGGKDTGMMGAEVQGSGEVHANVGRQRLMSGSFDGAFGA